MNSGNWRAKRWDGEWVVMSCMTNYIICKCASKSDAKRIETALNKLKGEE